MIPFIAAGVGALIGAGVVYIFSEDEKETLRENITKMDETLAKSEARVRRAADREIKNRLELLNRTLEWSKDRQTMLLVQNQASIAQLERVYSVAVALEMIIAEVPDDGILPEAQQEFVDVIIKAQNKQPLSAKERGGVEDFLDAHVGNKRRDFLEKMLANTYKKEVATKAKLDEDKDNCEFNLIKIEQRGRLGHDVWEERARILSRIARSDERLEEIHERIQDLELALVVVSRVSRPEIGHDENDDAAYDIVALLARGEALTFEERQFMESYQARYFTSAREILKETRGIDLATQGAA